MKKRMGLKEAAATLGAKRLVQLDLNKDYKKVPGVQYRESATTGKLRPIKPKVRRDG